MRFLVVIALCLAVASANQWSNRNRFNRMLRNSQHQQQQGYGTQGMSYNDQDDYDTEDQGQDDDEGNNYQQQQQCRRNPMQCQRRNQNMNDDDTDSEYGNNYQDDDDQMQQQDQDDDDYQGGQGGQQGGQWGQQGGQWGQQGGQGGQQGGRQNQQQKRRQQQQHRCQAKYQLLQQLEQPNAQLASKLYKQAKQENDDKNTVCSPTAIQLALAAIEQGARGNTKRQIQRITGAGLSQQQNKQAHAALQNTLQGQGPNQQQQQQTGQQGQKVKTTTTIVINQRNRAQQRFVQAVKACTNAQVKKCNFQQQPQQCRQQINRLIAQKTNHKLQHCVPQEAITENTKMIVVSTTQVKAKWGRQFRNQQQTKQGTFYPLGGQQPKRVQMLKSRGQFNHYEDEQLQVVGIPTKQQELTLYVIVPKNKQGLNQIEKQQIENGQQLKELLDNADQQRRHIDIELPKIQIKHKLDAKQTLRKEGIKDIFDVDEADLTKINGQQQQEQDQLQQQGGRRNQWQLQQQGDNDQDQEDQYDQEQGQGQGQSQTQQQAQQQLHVNKLIHQATIKIDEQGISAARTRNQGQQQQGQYQDQDHDQDQDQDQDDQYDDEEDYGQQQQWKHQQTYNEIFGQHQRRNRRQQGQQGQRRNHRQQQYQTQYDDQDQDQDQDDDQYQGQGQSRQYQGQQNQGQKKVKANRGFAFALKHNPSNQIVLVGRVVDAAQKPKNQQQGQNQQGQTLNGVDQQ